MRRETLIAGIHKVVDDLRSSGIPEMIEGSLRSRTNKEGPPWFQFEVYHRYAVASSQYSEVEREIIRIVGLSQLLDPSFWNTAIREIDRSIIELNLALRAALQYLPKIATLLENPEKQIAREDPDALTGVLRGKRLLTVILAEEEAEHSTPARLITALSAVTDAYYSFSKMHSLPGNDLLVLTCDSGSDKSFDFMGFARTIEQTKEFFLGVYDRVAFHKQTQATANLAVVADSLPVIAQINRMVEEGTLPREEGEILRRKLVGSATRFIECGAITGEIEALPHTSPRSLMRPQPKLLAGPTQIVEDAPHPENGEPTTETTDADPLAGLSSAELAKLRNLLTDEPAQRRRPPQRARTQKGD